MQPYAIRYVDAGGSLHDAADFVGEMSFVQSVIAIMNSGGMTAELIRLPSIPTTGAHRRELAKTAHAAIASVLRPNPAFDDAGNLLASRSYPKASAR